MKGKAEMKNSYKKILGQGNFGVLKKIIDAREFRNKQQKQIN